jgi:hypothetical protein
MFVSPRQCPKRAEKASLLTASGMLLHAFPSMFVSSLREFPESCAYKHVSVNSMIINCLPCLSLSLSLASNTWHFTYHTLYQPRS